ncbi:hypothetical protein [Mucilaginibacter sp. RCC_168]|uniref:hypothetical protein n=1 Tax=Mucilaginibacter sp. RCC_168 TaxID=3239221 RepID=UPI003526093D
MLSSTGGNRRKERAAPLVPPFKQSDNRKSDYRRTAKAAGRFWRGSTSVYMAIAIYTDSGTGPWPVSGASYVSAMPKLAGPRSCYRIRGDFFEDFLTN